MQWSYILWYFIFYYVQHVAVRSIHHQGDKIQGSTYTSAESHCGGLHAYQVKRHHV